MYFNLLSVKKIDTTDHRKSDVHLKTQTALLNVIVLIIYIVLMAYI